MGDLRLAERRERRAKVTARCPCAATARSRSSTPRALAEAVGAVDHGAEAVRLRELARGER